MIWWILAVIVAFVVGWLIGVLMMIGATVASAGQGEGATE